MPQYSQTGDNIIILTIFIGHRYYCTYRYYRSALLPAINQLFQIDVYLNFQLIPILTDFRKQKILIRITWELHTLTVIKLLVLEVLLLIKWGLHPLKNISADLID